MRQCESNKASLLAKPKQMSREDIEKLGVLLRERLKKSIFARCYSLNAEQWLNLHKHFGPCLASSREWMTLLTICINAILLRNQHWARTETARSVKA